MNEKYGRSVVKGFVVGCIIGFVFGLNIALWIVVDGALKIL